MVTPTNSSNPFASSGNPLDTTSSSFGNVGSSLSNDSNVFPSTTSFGSSSSYPNQESVVSQISNAFDSVSNSLPLTSTTDTTDNPFTSSGNGAQNFGLKLRTAIDSMVGGVGGSGAGMPGSVTGSESSGNGAPTTGGSSSGSGRPNLGPFDRLLDIPGVSVENIFGGFGGGGDSGGPSGGGGGFSGGGVNPFSNFGNPRAGENPLLKGITGKDNPWSDLPGAETQTGNSSTGDSSFTGGASSFGGDSSFTGGGSNFGGGSSIPFAADAGTVAPTGNENSSGGQWKWDFSALEDSDDDGGMPSFGGGSGGGMPSFGGGSGGGMPSFGSGSGGGMPSFGGGSDSGIPSFEGNPFA